MQKSAEENFHFVVMTNSRVTSTVRILGQLTPYRDYGNIVLSDSGGRGIDTFHEASETLGIPIGDILYVDNSEHRLDSIRHFHSILESDLKNMFIFHDDDEVVSDSLTSTLHYLEDTEVEYLCSTKTVSKQFLEGLQNCNQATKINRILKSYFLSYDGNCPLFTGLFVKYPKKALASMDPRFAIPGKYADVAIMSWFISQQNGGVAELPYIKYIEHDGNGNKIRNLVDRVSLSKFVRESGGITNYILSLLIFRGYPEKIHLYCFGILASALWPTLWPSIIKKLIYRCLTLLISSK